MDLFEYEGKALLKYYGIPVPDGKLVCAENSTDITFPVVLKAQVLSGGRGKAGGVRICNNESDYSVNASDILHLTIKGHKVHGLLAEEVMHAEKEFYISITLQGGAERPILIASSRGGMDIETVAQNSPEDIYKAEIEPFVGIKEYQLKLLAQKFPGVDYKELATVVLKLYRAFTELNAVLVEINPLGLVNGKLIAMDAKVVLDDNAQKKMGGVFENIRSGRAKLKSYEEPKNDGTTITFVPLSGNIGLISDGAGTGMLTLDLLTDAGGSVASFCELGGITNADVMYRAMEDTLPPGNGVKSIIVVLIGGFNKMDDMANGITRYVKDHDLNVPIFCRMCGTMEKEGIAIMTKSGLMTYSSLMDVVSLSVEAAGRC